MTKHNDITTSVAMYRRSLYFLGTVLMLAACGSAPPRPPVALELAQKAEQAAHRALRDGDLPRAEDQFKFAALRYQALDMQPPYAQAVINLASVHHRTGNNDAALSLLETLLADTSGQIPVTLKAVAAFRRSVILLDMKQIQKADLALKETQNLCLSSCELASAINNLHARLLLEQGDLTAALQVALKVTQASPAREELANALRVAGGIENTQKQFDAARKHFEQALEIDKELAHGKRIAEDLNGLSNALRGLGQNEEAERYARRAQAVTEATQLLQANIVKK